MIVSRDNFQEIVNLLSTKCQFSLDTETYGLKNEDRLFSLIIGTDTEAYYFNFNDAPDHLGNKAPDEWILPRSYCKQICDVVLNAKNLVFMHNAKFDMHKIANEGVTEFPAIIADTEMMCRLIYNAHMKYSLEKCAERIGFKKDDAVEAYITKHKLWTKQRIPGKKEEVKNKHFNLVPFDIMAKYAMTDARVTYDLGVWALNKLRELDAATIGTSELPWLPVFENECEITKSVFAMERRGILLDVEYTKKALQLEMDQLAAAKLEFLAIANKEMDGKKETIESALVEQGETVKHDIETGNAMMDKKQLAKMQSPIARLIERIRKHETAISTFYSGFLFYANPITNIVHCNYRQAGTATGRFSCSNPNMQNLKKDEYATDEMIQVRRCFVPRPGYIFAMFDFAQQEYRLMLDYANEKVLINRIVNEKLDIHQATADMVGITRKQAKTLNFGLLYGQGKTLLAQNLGISETAAGTLKQKYFSVLPNVQKLIQGIMHRGQTAFKVYNWFGRRCHIDDRKWAYKLPNHVIQGGGADIVKIAMNKIHKLLLGSKSGMVAQIHDEIVCEIHESEMHFIPMIKDIMEKVYAPKNGLPMEVTCEISRKSLAECDKEDLCTI